jgi:hypothetical protein
LDVHLMVQADEQVEVAAVPPDADGLRGLAWQVGELGQPVRAAIESMNGARFVHDQLELAGWEVQIADAQKVKGQAPLACKTDRIDAWVLAELSRRDLVPEIWLPTPGVRAKRERARFRLHLVRHRTALKNRVHATLLAFGKPCTASDLFGADAGGCLGGWGCRSHGRARWWLPWRSSTTWTSGSPAASGTCAGWVPTTLHPVAGDRPGSPGCWAPPSPPRWATSAGSPRPSSCVATPGCAHGSPSPAIATIAARWPRTAPDTCGGR